MRLLDRAATMIARDEELVDEAAEEDIIQALNSEQSEEDGETELNEEFDEETSSDSVRFGSLRSRG